MTPRIALLLSLAVPCFGGETVEQSDELAASVARGIEAKVPVSLAEGLEAKLWASEAMMTDPVAIDVTDEGEVWVSATLRRRSSMFDIRGFDRWVADSWSWETVEERVAFLHRELSPENSDKNEWVRDFNQDGSHDWRDLVVETDEVYRLKDESGDGRADVSERFTWIPSSEETDIASALLVHEGSVYLGLVPDVWRIQDLDKDGEYETKEAISSGYGIHIGIGGHAISGLKVGPDGRIYWGIGDVGFNGVDQDGKRWKYPRQGVLVRAEPDGSGFEVYAHGLRNLHEFDWDAYGNLIGVDNDGDHAGEDERLVYLIDGSDTGWRNNWQLGKYTDPKNNDYKVWMDEWYCKPRFDTQAAHILPPLDNYHTGPAGLVFQPGTALGGRWKDHFFVASFTGNPANSRVYAYSLKPDGAAFRLDNNEEILSGITSVGIDFGPDGALYLADWVGGWDTDGVGRVWKVDTVGGVGIEAQVTADLLKEDFSKRSIGELVTFLGNEDRRVRMKAQFALVKQGKGEALLEAAREGETLLKRVHGIWGTGQLVRYGELSGEGLVGLLKDEDAEIRAQAARTLGDVRYEPAVRDLRKLLADESPRIRLMATEALGRIGNGAAFEAIVSMLVANEDEDVYLRHAGAIALSRIDDGGRLQLLESHESRGVRIAAVVALGRLEHEGVALFVDDADELIATAAARAINDEEHVKAAMPVLASALVEREGASEAFTRRAINANLYVGSKAAAMRLADFALEQRVKMEMRIEAIDTLKTWVDPSIYDRVSGRVLERPVNELKDAQMAMVSAFDALFAEKELELRIAAIEAVGELGVVEFEGSLLQIVSEGDSWREREAAMLALIAMESEMKAAGVEAALADVDARVRSAALDSVGGLGVEDEVAVSLFELAAINGEEGELQSAVKELGKMESVAAKDVLVRQWDRWRSGEFNAAALLELIDASKDSGYGELEERYVAYRNDSEKRGTMGLFEASLWGGDAERGRGVVYSVPAAQCIRCHAIGGEGGDVGPELQGVGKRLDREALWESVVDPSAKIALGYGIVSLTTKGERSVQGVLVAESAGMFEVRTSGGDLVKVAESDVIDRVDAPSSMPPMGLLLTPEQVRDVVAFLASLTGGVSEESESSEGGHG